MTTVIQDERIHRLSAGVVPSDSDYVLYWMQSAVRTTDNHALEFAAQVANDLGLPLLVGFGIDALYPESSARHHRFMLEGIAAIASPLARRRIGLSVEIGHPVDVAVQLGRRAAVIVTDRGYLRHLREWRQRLVGEVDVPIYEIETNVIVPVETVSPKEEYAARTIRPRIHRRLAEFLLPLDTTALHHDGTNVAVGIDVSDPAAILARLAVDGSVPPTDRFTGGQHQAAATLRRFVSDRLVAYDDGRGEPGIEATSGLSPYLHFGHISPLTAVLAAREASGGSGSGYDSFVEELVVRRDLSHNFTWYQPDYDSYRSLPEWARQSLAEHRDDPREEIYTRAELEAGETHDPHWNAAMAEMRETGYLHNYMRMYWGKQILRWTNTPEYAFETALYLNNRYLLDGRDPNSYAGVGWCFGLHDRAWPEREVFGKVRTMTAGGLERKKDVDAYLAFVEDITGLGLGTQRRLL